MASEVIGTTAADAVAIARRTDWDVTWNGNSAGFVDEVDPALKIETKPIKFGTTGDHILGMWVSALTGTIKVQFRQINLAAFKSFTPWAADGATLPLVPKSPTIDLYNYAALLTLHPHDAIDTTQDMNFAKATPMNLPSAIKRDGSKDDIWNVEFSIFPDRDKITASPPVILYGWIGDAQSPPF